jgi:hypothetical protein
VALSNFHSHSESPVGLRKSNSAGRDRAGWDPARL